MGFGAWFTGVGEGRKEKEKKTKKELPSRKQADYLGLLLKELLRSMWRGRADALTEATELVACYSSNVLRRQSHHTPTARVSGVLGKKEKERKKEKRW
jgi:hypothetical protein